MDIMHINKQTKKYILNKQIARFLKNYNFKKFKKKNYLTKIYIYSSSLWFLESLLF